jgi:hypothetical protein
VIALVSVFSLGYRPDRSWILHAIILAFFLFGEWYWCRSLHTTWHQWLLVSAMIPLWKTAGCPRKDMVAHIHTATAATTKGVTQPPHHRPEPGHAKIMQNRNGNRRGETAWT